MGDARRRPNWFKKHYSLDADGRKCAGAHPPAYLQRYGNFFCYGGGFAEGMSGSLPTDRPQFFRTGGVT